MDFTQLEMFVATAEARGVQRAAERVFRSQPAVSMAMRKLEQEVGAPLFDRSMRGAYRLTAAGELLYASAKRLLTQREDALAEVKDLHDLERGRVRIGANESAGNYLLPRLIYGFRKQHPKIRIDVTRQNSTELIRDLRDNAVDLALIAFRPESKEIEAAPVLMDGLILIVGANHRLARSRRVKLKGLASESFIAHTVASPSRNRVVDAFRASGTPLNIVMEVAMIETIKKLIAMNLGIGFIPEMCVQEEIERGALVRVAVEDFSYERTLWLARRVSAAHSPAAAAFATTVLRGAKFMSGHRKEGEPA